MAVPLPVALITPSALPLANLLLFVKGRISALFVNKLYSLWQAELVEA